MQKRPKKLFSDSLRGDVWKVTDHPDQSNYPGQKLYFVIVDSYIYVVPYIVEKDFSKNNNTQQEGNKNV
ncbi:hypothetical protein DS62_13770 [Smithella sp. SC_K08D17]|nr:hypothetical protein DS62_13770 [Smithella sp. SC_K08D17]